MKTAPSIERAPRLVVLGLVLLTAVVSITRLVGIDYLLPHLSEPDQYLVPQTEYLWEGGHPKAAPLFFFWYYSLIPQVVALTPDPSVSAAKADPESLAAQLRAASEPLVRVRLAVALLSILVAPLTFFVARRFMPPWDSLLAAALAATSFLQVQFATQARPHAAQTSLALLAILTALRLRSRPRATNYALAGFSAALAVGCLQNGFFVLPALFAAHLLRERPGDAAEWRKRPFAGAGLFALALVPVVASFLWFGPALNEEQADERVNRAPFGRQGPVAPGSERESYTDPLAVRDGAIELGPQRLVLEWFDGSGFLLSVKYVWWNDPVLLVLGALGIALILARAASRWRAVPREQRRPPVLGTLDRLIAEGRARDLAVVAAYALPFFLVLGSYSRTWGRFLLPVLPHLACAAAFAAGWGIRAATRRMSSKRALAAGVMASALLALPVFASLHRFVLQLRPDTVELARDWIAENIDPRQARILIGQSLTLPLFHREDALQTNLGYAAGEFSRWLCYQDLFLDPAPPERAYEIHMMPQRREVGRAFQNPARAIEFLRASQADYVVLELSQRTQGLPEQRGLRNATRHLGRLVASFSPHAGSGEDILFMDYQDAPRMVWRNLRADRLGPKVEIYRIERSARTREPEPGK